MTVQRLYSLPNCSLLLEGVGDIISLNPSDARVPMATLINVECRLAGQEKPISGGREFLNSLIAAVSQYAQELLSGLNAKGSVSQDPTQLVQIERVSETVHRMKVRSQPLDGNGDVAARAIELNTVQFFDLVEAIDQLLADTQTLPDLKLNLQPLSRRNIAREKAPTTRQTIPAAIGLAGLAATAFAFSLLPIPKVEAPKDLYPVRKEQATSNPSPSPSPTGSTPPASSASPSPTATTSPDLNTLEANLNSPTEISDTQELEALGNGLREKLEQTWSDRAANTQTLTYQVGVNKAGAIQGYKALNSSSTENVSKTPLLDLLPRTTPASSEPLALFKVVFTGTGNVEVAPWRQVMTSPISGVTEITETAQLEAILPKLTSNINQNWSQTPTFTEELLFKVRVKADGTIVDYSPENDAAARYVQETPLAKLGKPIADETPAPAQEPLALFKVVINPPDGALEISPWRGWQD